MDDNADRSAKPAGGNCLMCDPDAFDRYAEARCASEDPSRRDEHTRMANAGRNALGGDAYPLRGHEHDQRGWTPN